MGRRAGHAASAAAFRHALTGLVDARIAARQAQADAAAAALGPHARSYLRAARPWRAFLAAERPGQPPRGSRSWRR